MATPSHAQAVKSLNKSSGRRRFVFKSVSQRLREIEIDVYRSLEEVKAEPSEGSSFFRDCLIEWRELNTAEDFISYYEEVLPLVQTLPLVLLHKETIFSKLVDRLRITARLSLEPILRLIAALSRDLLEDFFPFLPRVVGSLISLLKNGAEREPDIVEQIFSSWSYMLMYLQKYLIRDIVQVLRVTVNLRYFPKDHVRELMAESMSFLLRKAPTDQLIRGVRKIISEAVKKPSLPRISGVSAFLFYAMKGVSANLHSNAEQMLRLLMDKSIFHIGENFAEGSTTILNIEITTFERLCEELEPGGLTLIRNCLYEKIIAYLTDKSILHLTRLLTLLTTTVRVKNGCLVEEYGPLLELVTTLVQTFLLPQGQEVALEDDNSDIVDTILKLMLSVLQGLHGSNDPAVIYNCTLDWAPAFNMKRKSLLNFIGELVNEDSAIVLPFKVLMLRALDDLIEVYPEEVIHLLLCFFEKVQQELRNSNIMERVHEELSKVCYFVEDCIKRWIELGNNLSSGQPFSLYQYKPKLALLWGAIYCYPFLFHETGKLSLLRDLIDALDLVLQNEDDDIIVFPRKAWQSLVGAAISSYQKFHCAQRYKIEGASKFMELAEKYRSSPHILEAVADYLDTIPGSTLQAEVDQTTYNDLWADKVVDVIGIFGENLSHSDKRIRVSTLKILSHHQSLTCGTSTIGHLSGSKIGEEPPLSKSNVDVKGGDVISLLLSVEAVPLSVSTSRKVILPISKLQMDISAGRILQPYAPLILSGIIGIFHNRFSDLWAPASECLAVLISKHMEILWDELIKHLQECLSSFQASKDQPELLKSDLSRDTSDLIRRFHSFVNPEMESTPKDSVLFSLIQSLQKIPTIAEAKSRHLIPLFFNFLGYSEDEPSRVDSFDSRACKGKQWIAVLKEWLNLLKSMRNVKSFYRGQFLKEILQHRLLEDNDAEIQMKVLDCLVMWKDDYLLPYEQNLKNLISSKTLKEELTTWSLSRDSNIIKDGHRALLVPLIIRVLAPKVRTLKTLASRKHACVSTRKAVLRFISQVDVNELPLFFALLLKPLQIISTGTTGDGEWHWYSGCNTADEFVALDVLKFFPMDNIAAVSWKKRYGFLHVIENIIEIFDEFHLGPFLNLMMGFVVRILGSCSLGLGEAKNTKSSEVENYHCVMQNEGVDGEGVDHTLMGASTIQLKDQRSLCLKIISLVLNKYEEHDYGSEFWELFFNSVKSSIDSFRQEGSSSQKPSSLFSCFLAMSRSYRLVSLLRKEKNLIADIFSILSSTTASEAVILTVLKFVENLLNLDNDLGQEDSTIRDLLLVNLNKLIHSLHSFFLGNSSIKRRIVKHPGETQLRIFKLLPRYIEDPLLARRFMDFLLPFLMNSGRNSDVSEEILQVLQEVVPVLGSESGQQILSAVSPLLTSAALDTRLSVCHLLISLGGSDPSMLLVGKLLQELNATSTMDVEELDYDIIIKAYEKINANFFYSIQEDHALVILSQCAYDLSSDQLILRDSAYRSLITFVEFSAQVIVYELKNKGEMPEEMVVQKSYGWTKSSVENTINNFLLKQMGDAIKREASIKKGWIQLLREMVLKLPFVDNLNSLKPLYSDDAEVDFFNNIVHLQKHRRARALLRFRNVVITSNISEVILNKIFVPLFFNILFDVQEGKAEPIRNACVEALASVSSCMEWKSYHALMMRCFRDMTVNSDKQKLVLRLICAILDQFHFSKMHSNQRFKDTLGTVPDPNVADSCVTNKVEHLTKIQDTLYKSVLPKIEKLLYADKDKVNVHINLAVLKLLKLLPGDILDNRLPNIILRISNFLKNREESIRDEARNVLAACLKELGLEYLQFILQVLRATLKRGYQMHVLGYTLNFVLSKFPPSSNMGKVDYCLKDLLSVVENDILGNVSEEKEVEKIASKMKETKKHKSYETLKWIAQIVTFRTHAEKLLTPVTLHLQKHVTPKVKSKLESMLAHIASGIECNPSVDQTELFKFVYGLISDGMKKENGQDENLSVSAENKNHQNNSRGKTSSLRVISTGSPSSHIITVFALSMLHTRLKNLKIDKNDALLLSKLDPFVGLLCDGLTSKFEDIISASLRCLTPLVRLPLQSVELTADKIKAALFNIARSSADNSSPLMQSCLKLLTVLLQSSEITLSSEQIHMLVQFPMFVDLKKDPSSVALSLLKTIINCKLDAPEIYDLVTQVGELMVTSQLEHIRKKCSQILLQFLIDYELSEKRLLQHLNFLLLNLSYEHSTGREAVLEMLHAIIVKFRRPDLDKQSRIFFFSLVLCLANDSDSKVRSMAGTAIKHLVLHISPHSIHAILEMCLSWYQGGKEKLQGAAAQVLGLLIEVMKKSFQQNISPLLPVTREILHAATNAVSNTKEECDSAALPFWKEAYYSLVMLEKLFLEFQSLSFEVQLEDIWDAICDLMLYPHTWIRSIASRLVALYFANVTETGGRNNENTANYFLMRPSRLFWIAASLCCQLNSELDDATGNLVAENLVFAICGLNSLMGDIETVACQQFWLTVGQDEKVRLLKAFELLDPRKGRAMFLCLTSGEYHSKQGQDGDIRYSLVHHLLRKIGKLSLEIDPIQLKIVLSSLQRLCSQISRENAVRYAYDLLLPLYKICEGFSGKVIPENLKQLAQEVTETLRVTLGIEEFVQIYNQIRKDLQQKREKRKRDEKLMAVVNPVRNAKRKLRIAAKHRAHKRRKIMTMKMGRYLATGNAYPLKKRKLAD